MQPRMEAIHPMLVKKELFFNGAGVSGTGGEPYRMLVSHPWRKDWPPLIHVVELRAGRQVSMQTQVSSKAFCPFRMKSTLYLTINLPFENLRGFNLINNRVQRRRVCKSAWHYSEFRFM